MAEQRVALITGGGTGIGASTAHLLASEADVGAGSALESAESEAHAAMSNRVAAKPAIVGILVVLIPVQTTDKPRRVTTARYLNP
jgi:NAD(P)-dependent dehydrogenase (short-subunit alcohol dehydrogenase family)